MTNLSQDLREIEKKVKAVLRSKEWILILEAGYYQPETSLVDAITAVQEAIGTVEFTNQKTQVMDQAIANIWKESALQE